MESETKVVKRRQNPDPAVDDRLAGLEARFREISGKFEDSATMLANARKIRDRIAEKAKSGGRNLWKMTNSRYKDQLGNPISSEFWSDANTPAEALADYNRRNKRQWNVEIDHEPMKAELIKKNARTEPVAD
jgi:hypothetical protein